MRDGIESGVSVQKRKRDNYLTLFLDSIVRVKTACDRLLSLFMEVDATRLFSHPVRST